MKANDQITMLKKELQSYRDNASKGGINRRRNMTLLRWDIRKLERVNEVNNGMTDHYYRGVAIDFLN